MNEEAFSSQITQKNKFLSFPMGVKPMTPGIYFGELRNLFFWAIQLEKLTLNLSFIIVQQCQIIPDWCNDWLNISQWAVFTLSLCNTVSQKVLIILLLLHNI